MQLGSKVKIKQFLGLYDIPDKIGEIIAITENWCVVQTEVSGPQIAPFTVKLLSDLEEI